MSELETAISWLVSVGGSLILKHGEVNLYCGPAHEVEKVNEGEAGAMAVLRVIQKVKSWRESRGL